MSLFLRVVSDVGPLILVSVALVAIYVLGLRWLGRLFRGDE